MTSIEQRHLNYMMRQEEIALNEKYSTPAPPSPLPPVTPAHGRRISELICLLHDSSSEMDAAQSTEEYKASEARYESAVAELRALGISV